MTYKEKKTLYEGIMKQVAKVVKKHINEDEYYDDYDEDFDDNEEYAIQERIDDICMEFGDDNVVINGVLGLWDGKHTIQETPCEDLRSAIQKCIGQDGELMSLDDIEFDGETVSLSVHHHDGVNHFEITKEF